MEAVRVAIEEEYAGCHVFPITCERDEGSTAHGGVLDIGTLMPWKTADATAVSDWSRE